MAGLLTTIEDGSQFSSVGSKIFYPSRAAQGSLTIDLSQITGLQETAVFFLNFLDSFLNRKPTFKKFIRYIKQSENCQIQSSYDLCLFFDL